MAKAYSKEMRERVINTKNHSDVIPSFLKSAQEKYKHKVTTQLSLFEK